MASQKKQHEEPYPILYGEDLSESLPPVRWVSEGLGITAGAVTIIGGAGFGGKTVSMQSLALSVASGQPIWGQHPIAQGVALHIDYEQGRRLTQDRYQRLAKSLRVNLKDLSHNIRAVCLPRAHLCDLGAEIHLARLCEGVTIAIVDAFRGAFPTANENDSEARKWLDMLHDVSVKTGCAMAVIAHSRKSTDDEGVRASLRGSSALFDAAQSVYMLDGETGKPTRVHHTKDRVLGKTKPTFGLRISDEPHLDDPRWGLRVDYMDPGSVRDAYDAPSTDELTASAARLTSMGERVLALVTTDGTAASMLRSMVGGSATDLRAVLDSLVESGSIHREGKGSDAMYRRYREPGDEG